MAIIDWREFVGALPSDRKKQLRDVDLKISTATLSRWTNGSSPGDPQYILMLASLFPEIKPSLESEFPDAFREPEEPTILQVSRPSYEGTIDDLALVAAPVSEFTLNSRLFRDIKDQLDPGGDGLLIMPVLCERSDDAKVHQLVAQEGDGTDVWRFKQFKSPYHLYLNSLSGMAVDKVRPTYFPYDRKLAPGTSLLHVEKIKSAGAFPLLRRGISIAGVLFIASVHTDFLIPARRELCRHYANLYASTLYERQFYPLDDVELVRSFDGEKEMEQINV